MRIVEHVAGAQHRVDGVLLGETEELAHGVEARPAELRPVGLVERREAPAEVPVRGVKQLERHVVVSRFLHRSAKSTSRMRSETGVE